MSGFRTESRPQHRSARARLGSLLLPALLPAGLMLIEVKSVSVWPAFTSAGVGVTGTVQLDGESSSSSTSLLDFGGSPKSKVVVRLESSNVGVAKVPSEVLVAPGGSATFPVAVASSGAGCARIRASFGASSSKSALVYVRPASPPSGTNMTLTTSSNEIIGVTGFNTSGQVGLILPAQAGNGSAQTVQLSSSNPIVSVPAALSVPMNAIEVPAFSGAATFPITMTATSNEATCTVITATHGTWKVRALVKILPSSAIGG